MGKKTILDRHQKEFLALVLKEPYLLKTYYWTGGTVLSEFYLRHRESQDIDLFTEREVHFPSIEKFVGTAGTLLGAKKITHRRFLGLYSFLFKFARSELKVDFNYYPFPRINKGGKWRGLVIDSLEDIAVNKVHTLSHKAKGKRFCGHLFYLQEREVFIGKAYKPCKS